MPDGAQAKPISDPANESVYTSGALLSQQRTRKRTNRKRTGFYSWRTAQLVCRDFPTGGRRVASLSSLSLSSFYLLFLFTASFHWILYRAHSHTNIAITETIVDPTSILSDNKWSLNHF